MTITTHDGGGTMDAWTDPDDEFSSLGLEDIDGSDVVIPRIQINHLEGTFKDSLSGEEFKTLDVILLGLVKQRIMWPEDTEDGDKPLCRSSDATYGFPQVSERVSADKRFPFEESSFSPEAARALTIAPSTNRTHPNGWSSNGHPVLPCASCNFKEWGTNPKTGKGLPPRCSEQHTFPLLYTLDDGATWTPALFTVQRTGIKPSRSYIGSFAQNKRPLFTARTKLSLDVLKRGTVVYSVPNFERNGVSDKDMWIEFGERLKSMREWVRQAPRPSEEDVVVTDGSDDPWAAEAAKSTPTPVATPTTRPAAAAPAPVATPPAPAAAPAPAAPATPAPEATPATPTPPAEEVVIEQPAAPATPAPAAATPPPAAPAAAVDDDDDLPF